MRRFILLLWFCLVPCLSLAQEQDDRGYLTTFLESNLSGLGREVRIDGFSGALSSRATFTRLTIADAQGVWITVINGAIGWNRSALLRGRVDIAELSAERIELARAPQGSGATPEAKAFTLPELPVSVSIGALRTGDLRIAEPVFGQALAVAIEGSAQLSGGEGSASLSIRRIDGAEGTLAFSGSFANATGMATLDLLAREGPGGLAATLLGLPGTPSAELALHGSGPIKDFTVDLALGTDGAPHLTGTMRLEAAQAAGAAAPERRFAAKLSGDISPLLQPGYSAFFGSSVELEAEGRRLPGAGTEVTRLVLDSAGLDLTGSLSLTAENIPSAAALTLRLGLPDRDEMLLPFPGDPTYVRNGTLLVRFDREKGDDWTLTGNLDGIRKTGFALGSVVLDGKGRVLAGAGRSPKIVGALAFFAIGLAPDDPALASALGPAMNGRAVFTAKTGAPFRLHNLEVRAGDLGLSGALAFSRDGLDPVVEGGLTITAADMARFSGLAGRRLGGAAEIALQGRGALLSGAFDVTAAVRGEGLSIDEPMADRLLQRGSDIRLTARRDQTGITLENLDLRVSALTGHAQGKMTSSRHDLTAQLAFSDLSALGPGFGGGLVAQAALTGTPGAREVTLTGRGTDLRLGATVGDPLLRGATDVVVSAGEHGGAFGLTSVTLSNPQLAVEVAGKGERFAISGRAANMGLIVPEFPGPLTLTGEVTPGAVETDVSLEARGPGQTVVRVGGKVQNDFASTDLSISGSGQSALINHIISPRSVDGLVSFDLRLAGRPSLNALSGRIGAPNLRIASPAERISIEGAAVTADLGGGRAALTGAAQIRGGGDVGLSGSVGLAPPFDSALSVLLDNARLIDPALFETLASGRITITGPVLGGALIAGSIALKETEIIVAAPAYQGSDLPEIHHLNEPADVRATRLRAGLDAAGRRPTTPNATFGLDLTVSAPDRIFVRGFGLDAEMGGAVHLGGTTASVIASGQFDLIRGRLNLLGRRFVLEEGLVQLLGSFIPYVRFVASSDTFGSSARIVVEGPADEPEISFTSDEGLPEEEVLSQLLFGNGIDRISAFELAQLANAVATLTGRGGVDIVSRLRGNLRLDDLDVVADEEGNAALKAGKYLSDSIYSEVSVGSDGTAKVELDFGVSPNLSLKATAGSDGTSGAGIFFTRDY
jgi:translocation and assembly module TamB